MASKTILGISPGTRVLGIAIIINGQLVDWRVKTFKEKWSREKHTGIISIIGKLIDYYDVKVLSVKKIDPLKSSRQLDHLIESIEKLATRKRVSIKHYSLSDLAVGKRSGKRDGKAKLTEQLVEKHPELQKEYLKERNNRVEYYTKMFEAVAIAERCREW